MTRPLPILALFVLVTTIAFAMSPWLSEGFAGFSPAQFPIQQKFWPVQPVGWAFSIWGVIYAWLIFGAVWGLINAPHDPNWRSMRQPLLVSLGIGTFWVTAANASPVLATFMIVAMAVLATAAMLRAGLGNPAWQVRPVALYAGWLTAATGVGTGVVLSGYGILQPQASAMVMLSCVLIVALYVQSRRRQEWAYPIAVIWALCGVIASNMPSQNWPVIALAALGILALTYRTLKGRL